MITSRKRKVSEEHRTFNRKWEQKFLFTDIDGKPQCLVCSQVLAVSKGYNVSRHYNTLHKIKYDQYTGELRGILVKELKSKIRKQKTLLTMRAATASVAASYEVCLELVKWRNSFRDGEIVKRCAVKMARAFNDEEMARRFESVSLSHQSVARRVSEMNEHVFTKLKNIVHECKYFSLALDDSTEVNGIKQLLIFIRTIDENFSVHEELLRMFPLDSGTEGTDILTAIVSSVSEFGGMHKCTCILTNGSEAMVGSNKGLVRLLTEKRMDCVIFHCIVDQEVLLGKCEKMRDVMDSVVGIMNILRTNSKIHKDTFIPFLEMLNEEVCALPLHSSVSWISAGKCLQHFFSLREEIIYFFQNESTDIACQYQEQLLDDQFLRSLAFLTDLTQYLNTLNLNLLCKKHNVSQLVQHIEAFRKKLKLFSACLQKNDVTHFSSCRELLAKDSSADFSSFVEVTDNISADFDVRFANFDSLKPSLELFNNPMECVIEQQPPDLQLELCELQAKFFFMTKKNELYYNFWKLVSQERFPNLRDFGLKMCSMFGGTYLCENTISLMKFMKSETGNSMEKHALDARLRLATTSIPVNFEALVQAQQSPGKCSHKQDEEESVMDATSVTPVEDEGQGWLHYDPTLKEMVFVKDEQPDPHVVVKEEYSESF